MDLNKPLAFRMSPKTLEDYVGQEHILGKDKILYRTIKADRLSSIILWGPPGCGKTSLARVISNTTKYKFTKINAVTAGIGDIKNAIEEAKNTFLNPTGRSMIFKLNPLTVQNVYDVLKKSLISEEGLGSYKINIEDETLMKIAETSNGDVRTALNGLEVAVLSTKMDEYGVINITNEIAKECVQTRKAIFDKNGDSHYDNISAFIKSMRGSDPDATLFYLARAINAGEDPVFIARRIVIAAAEDVGMANPNALVVATSAMQSITMIGMPEARIILAEAAVYVATSPKSNAAYLGIDKALADVTTKDTGTIPMHIRNAPAEGMKNEGYGVGYKYPHDYPMHQVEQQYLPDKMLGTKYYIKDDTVN